MRCLKMKCRKGQTVCCIALSAFYQVSPQWSKTGCKLARTLDASICLFYVTAKFTSLTVQTCYPYLQWLSKRTADKTQCRHFFPLFLLKKIPFDFSWGWSILEKNSCPSWASSYKFCLGKCAMHSRLLWFFPRLCSVVFSVKSFSAVPRFSNKGLQYFSEGNTGAYLYFFTLFLILFLVLVTRILSSTQSSRNLTENWNKRI